MISHHPHTSRGTDASGTFAASREAPSRARHWLAPRLPAAARELGALAVTEIVTNAVVHGRIAAGESIVVRAVERESCWRVSVAHRGAPFAVPPRQPPGTSGGWGFALVDAVAAAWGVEHHPPRVVVWFELPTGSGLQPWTR